MRRSSDLRDSVEPASRRNADKIIAAALQLGKLDSTEWEIEGEPEIQLHPVQNAPGNTSIQ